MQGGYYKPQGINKRVLSIVFLGISIFWYAYSCLLSFSGFVSLRDFIQQALMIVSAVIMIVYMAMNHKSNSGRILFCIASAIAALSSLVNLPLLVETISFYVEDVLSYEYYGEYLLLQFVYIISCTIRYAFVMMAFIALAILSLVKKPLRGLKISLCAIFAVLVIASFAMRFAMYMYINLDDPCFGITIIQTLAWYIPDLFFAAALIVYFAANRTYGPEKNATVHTMPYAVYSPASIEQSIFALKASFERGEISEAEYQMRRQDLLNKL